MAAVNITLETLFDLLRTEKNREELQVLEPTFYKDVVHYMNEKRAILDSQTSSEFFTQDDKEKSMIQYNNIKRMVREIYEKRERKIIQMAQNKSKTNASIIDTSSLLDEERIFYEELVYLFNKYRQDIIVNMLEGVQPSLRKPAALTEPVPKPSIETPKQPEQVPPLNASPQESSQGLKPESAAQSAVSTSTDQSVAQEMQPSVESSSQQSQSAVKAALNEVASTDAQAEPSELIQGSQTISPVQSTEKPTSSQSESNAPQTTVSMDPKMVRFLQHVPQFVGEDLEILGPFAEDDIANLPPKVADILIKKGRAEEITEG